MAGGKRGRPAGQTGGLLRLRKNLPLLRVLADSRQPLKLRTAIVKTSRPELVGTVSECCRGVLNGSVPLTANQRRQLAVHARAIRLLAEPRASIQAKRNVLLRRPSINQRGGFLGTLLSIAVPVAIDLLARHLSKSQR